jgi:hypothetical protein
MPRSKIVHFQANIIFGGTIKFSRGQCCKMFYGSKLQIFVISLVLVPGKLFQPSLMFVGKARTLPWSGAPERPVKLGWKGLPGTHDLA